MFVCQAKHTGNNRESFGICSVKNKNIITVGSIVRPKKQGKMQNRETKRGNVKSPKSALKTAKSLNYNGWAPSKGQLAHGWLHAALISTAFHPIVVSIKFKSSLDS